MVFTPDCAYRFVIDELNAPVELIYGTAFAVNAVFVAIEAPLKDKLPLVMFIPPSLISI